MVSIVIDRTAGQGPHGNNCRHDHAAAHGPVAALPVSVNGVSISRKDIAVETQNFTADNPGAAWHAAARALVIRELLVQEAARLAIAAEPQADDEGRMETDEDALLRALIEREIRTPEADEETLRRFYENNRKRFITPPLFEADHILVAAHREDALAFAAARDKAAALALVLAAEPERFVQLARDCSDCPSAKVEGGRIQFVQGETTPEFEAALATLAPGEISPPVEARYGIHLVRLVRKVEGSVLPFEAVKDRIADYLEEHVRGQATAQYISLLIGRADISGIELELEGAATPLVQ
ncbi:peptidylprolyl isomerase [Phyllobacterium phragmitis]|uniref:Parvulin-like PPIase n=1 Tax=Phyllobacterium phragmitis TaxID=2670329 RepID=A0A2S9IMX1_9HYPH|nr:peptidylprolyl isomerase [Phyllobacterium phragmitis]PRD41865.1 peptidylprolyl isomerase [Phyllobacterium phragmitis]